MYDFGEPISGDPFIEQNIFIGLIPLILALIALIIHIAFGVAVFKDSTSRRDEARIVWFVHPIFWGGATLVGGVFVAAVYWLIHYSTLAAEVKTSGDLPSET
jgi:hypothetical protein